MCVAYPSMLLFLKLLLFSSRPRKRWETFGKIDSQAEPPVRVRKGGLWLKHFDIGFVVPTFDLKLCNYIYISYMYMYYDIYIYILQLVRNLLMYFENISFSRRRILCFENMIFVRKYDFS